MSCTTVGNPTTAAGGGKDDSVLLSRQHLLAIKEQFDGAEESIVLDATSCAKQLVDHALAVEDERIQERATFARKLSEVQAALASSVASSALQRKLQQVDYDQLEKQAQLLAGKVGEGQRSGVKDSEAATTNGYQYVYGVTQQKIENQQLKLDVGFLQRRLRNSEAQVTRLTTELRHLRPLALHGAPLLTYDTELILPPAPSNPRPRPRPPTLGDAAAEHLLLAGRTLSHARRIRRVPLSRALVEKAGEVVEGGWSDEWGRGVDELDVLEEEVGKDKGRERGEQAPRPRGKRRRVEVEAMGAGGGDWDFGLGGGEEEIDVDGFLANGGGGGGGGAGLTRGISALDVLAQASASQESQDQHEPTPPLVEAASHSYATRPTTLAASQATAAQMAKLQAEAGEMGGEGEGQVAGGGGGGGGGWEPARQQYIKWNVDEDEELCNAVLKHGLRWDQVAREISSRTYHQCRQRFLRGLKSGHTLPSSLAHLAPSVRAKVKEHEQLKKESKGKGKRKRSGAGRKEREAPRIKGFRAAATGGSEEEEEEEGEEEEW